MKKLSLLMIFCFLAFASAQSQGNNFGKGDAAINVGMGLGNTIYGGYAMGIPSISASFEIGIVEVPMGSELKGIVSVGGILGWDNMNDNLYWGYAYGNYKSKINAFFFAARGNYHFIFVENLDLYAGVMLGVYHATFKYDWDNYVPGAEERSNKTDVYPGAYVGARYFFSPKFAVYSELGRAISVFNFGVTFKF